MEQGRTLSEYLGALRRRAWVIVAAILIGTPIAYVVAQSLPPVYSATAKLLVEKPQISATLAPSTVTDTAAERLNLIEQRLMTRENLIAVAERLDLFAAHPELSPSAMVSMMRKSTLIESETGLFGSTRSRRSAENVSILTIAYESNQAEQSARVANEFVRLIVDWNQLERSERAAETEEFFQQEVQRLAGALEDIEARISAYKRENDAALPESLEFRRAELESIKVRMFERDQQKLALEESKRALLFELSGGDGATDDRWLSDDEKELRNLERTYAEQSAVYATSHPTMRRLKLRIDGLRKTVAAADGGGSAEKRRAETEKQIRLIDAQIASYAEQRASDEARLAALEASIAKTPDVSMVLGALDRRRTDLQTEHGEALLKQSQAQLGHKLEENRQSERLEILESARVPEGPAGPPRNLITAGGAAGSALLGVALALLIEILSTTIRTPRDVERWLGIRPVITIPYIRTAHEVSRRGRRFSGVASVIWVAVPAGLILLGLFHLSMLQLSVGPFDQGGADTATQFLARQF